MECCQPEETTVTKVSGDPWLHIRVNKGRRVLYRRIVDKFGLRLVLSDEVGSV